MIPKTLDFSDTARYEHTDLTPDDVLQLYRARLPAVAHYGRAQGRGWQGRPSRVGPASVPTARSRPGLTRTPARQPVSNPNARPPRVESMTR